MPADLVVRTLGAGDLALVTGAEPEVFDHPVSPARAREFLADPGHHIVGAIVEGRLAGFASAVVCLHPDRLPELFVMELGVAPRLHRQGIGRRLLDAVLAVGAAEGCGLAWVPTEAGNAPAQALYRAAGGVPDDELATIFTFRLPPPPGRAAGAGAR